VLDRIHTNTHICTYFIYCIYEHNGNAPHRDKKPQPAQSKQNNIGKSHCWLKIKTSAPSNVSTVSADYSDQHPDTGSVLWILNHAENNK
jgi:hypothetical protein